MADKNSNNRLIQRITRHFRRKEKHIPVEQPKETGQGASTRLGYESADLSHVYSFQNLLVDAEYWEVVEECTRLAIDDPIFSSIIHKLVKTTAAHKTLIEVDKESRKGKKAKKILTQMLKRIKWEGKKDTLIANMLNEGGVSWEVIMTNPYEVAALDYRPHHSIVPQVNEFGDFEDKERAFIQRVGYGAEVASFAKWQIIDVAYKEHPKHNRGVPHLHAARTTLSNISVMLKGMLQKWGTMGTMIEHFNLKNGGWAGVKRFQKANAEALGASPENMLRQFFSSGEVSIERLSPEGSNKSAGAAMGDANTVEFMMDLIFMATGVSKEVLGFKSETVIRDMVSLSVANYYTTLNFIQDRMFVALRQLCDWELLLNNIHPDEVEYAIKGGVWVLEEKPIIPPWVLNVVDKEGKKIVCVNDIRRSVGLKPSPNPAHDVIGELDLTLDIYNMPKEDRNTEESKKTADEKVETGGKKASITTVKGSQATKSASMTGK